MRREVFEMLEQAKAASALYNQGLITREEAKIDIDPYVELYNLKSKEIAKKYGVTPRYLSFIQFVRR